MTLSHLPQTEQAVLDLIRYQGSMSVRELCEHLGVTATAIRQRLKRLTAAGLLEWVTVRRERGRPVHQYRMTEQGRAAMGENLADLAEMLWLEVINIEEESIRQSVLEGVLQRLTERYRDQVTGGTITQRLESIAELFRQRKIPFVVETEGNQSHLRIAGCPYPRLQDRGSEICQMEQQLVARLLDAPVALNHCSCASGGGRCCTFSAEAAQQLNRPPLGDELVRLDTADR